MPPLIRMVTIARNRFSDNMLLQTLTDLGIKPLHLVSNLLIAITANQTYLECLRVRLKKVLRIILSCGIETQINKMYSTLQFLKMDDIFEFELYKFMHQLHHGKLPEVFYKSFAKITSVHAHNTRFKQTAFYPYRVLTRAFAKTNCPTEGRNYGVNWTITIKAYI